ncbi:MAG: hypothetical protein ACK4Y5_00740 [Acetobacteraceae bacterium]|jgi:hypothetical protein
MRLSPTRVPVSPVSPTSSLSSADSRAINGYQSRHARLLDLINCGDFATLYSDLIRLREYALTHPILAVQSNLIDSLERFADTAFDTLDSSPASDDARPFLRSLHTRTSI